MQTEIIQVALVDDHALFRSGIALLINSFKGYNIMLEANNGKEFSDKISPKFKPQIVLLDISMPEMDGLETTNWLNKHYPEIKVIIISMSNNADKVLALVKMGIMGYLLKESDWQEFKEALDTVSNNEIYYPPFVTRHLVKNLNIEAPAKQVKLNPRELAFLKFVGTELTYKEIADVMCVSTRTVDGYRDQLFEKLNIKSRVGLVMYAIKNKLIKFD